MSCAAAIRALGVVLERSRNSSSWCSVSSCLVALSQALQPCDPARRGDHACFTSWQVRGLKTITDVAASRQESTTLVFDGVAKALHRDRAALLARSAALTADGTAGTQAGTNPADAAVVGPSSADLHTYHKDPLLTAITDRLLDRLHDCKGRDFTNVLVLGGAAIHVLNWLAAQRPDVKHITVVDTSPGMLALVQEYAAQQRAVSPAWPDVTTALVNPDEEMLPLQPGTCDLAVSCLGLHWYNDLPTFMAQCRFALRDDGLFLAALFAEDTLQELRIACSVGQQERLGGIAPVVSPFARVRDGGNLLTRAGLSLPAVDMDQFVVHYKSGVPGLVEHLRVLGEQNATVHRLTALPRDAALAAAAVYQSMFGGGGSGGGEEGGNARARGAPSPATLHPELANTPPHTSGTSTDSSSSSSSSSGSVPATYEIMFLTGWAPHESQQRPARRGSATVSFQDLADGLVGSGQAHGGSTGEGGEEACGVSNAAQPPPQRKP